MKVSGRQKRPGQSHPISDLTSSMCSLSFSGSALVWLSCWAMELSESGSTSVTAAALGSDTSLQVKVGWGEEKKVRERRLGH